jgi:paraquat-inducible protein B
LEEITRSVSQVLDKLASLPLEELVTEMQATVKSVNALVSLPSLHATLQTVDREVGPLAKSMRATSDEARAMIATTRGFVNDADRVPNDLTVLLKELASAARSIRVFADYLERHPEALIRGKGTEPGE